MACAERRVVAGENYGKLPRLAELEADDAADLAAGSANRGPGAQQEAWLKSRKLSRQ
jgi:hypothetical protein